MVDLLQYSEDQLLNALEQADAANDTASANMIVNMIKERRTLVAQQEAAAATDMGEVLDPLVNKGDVPETDYQAAKRGTKTNLLTSAAQTTEDFLSSVVTGVRKPAAGVVDLLSDAGVPIEKADKWLGENVPFLGQASRFISGKQATAEQRSPTAAMAGEMTGEIGALMSPSTAISKVGSGLSLLPRMGIQAVGQGGLTAATTATEGDGIFEGRGMALGLGAAGGAAGEAIGAGVKALSKANVPTEAALARARGLQLLEEAGGSPIGVERGQLRTGETVIGDKALDLPLSGQQKFRERTMDEIERALRAKVASTSDDVIGEADDLILDAVEAAQKGERAKLGQLYKDVEKRAAQTADEAVEARTAETIGSHPLFANYVDPNKIREATQKRITGAPKATNATVEAINTDLGLIGELADQTLAKDVRLISSAVNNADSFKQLKAARERVNQMSNEAFRSGRFNEPYNKLKSAIDEDMAAYVERIGDPSLASSYRQANQEYRKFREFWNSGSVKGLTRKEEGHELYNSLVRGDASTRNKRFKEIITKLEPEQQTLTKKALTSKYLISAIEAGTDDMGFSANKFANYMQKNKHMLDYMDDATKKEYENILKFLRTTKSMETKKATGLQGLTLGSLAAPVSAVGLGASVNPIMGVVLGAVAARGTGAFARSGEKASKLISKFNNARTLAERERIMSEIVDLSSNIARPVGLSMVNEE